MLSKASHGFRTGYWHAISLQPSKLESYAQDSFIRHDYAEGWQAGINELYWEAQRENQKRNQC